MDLLGKSPVPLPVLLVGKTAFLGTSLFVIVKLMDFGGMLYNSLLTTLLGGVLYIGGLTLVILAVVQLGRSIAVGLPERETELKTDGLYGVSRNPIYAGGFIMGVGSCLYAIHPINIILLAVAVAVHVAIVKREEKFLRERFGAKWMEYAQRVPRFIGRIRKPQLSRTTEEEEIRR